MSSSIKAPRLDSFSRAKEWFHMVKPIRGNKEGRRPLGVRRYHACASIDMPDENTVALVYYRVPFVLWRSDNTLVVKRPSYITAFSVDDLSGFLPPGMWVSWVDTRPFISFDDGAGIRKYLMKKGDEFEFTPTGPRTFEMKSRPEAYNYVRRKDALPRVVNRKFAPFLDWATVVVAVSGAVDTEASERAQGRLSREAGVPSLDDYVKFSHRNPVEYRFHNVWEDQRMLGQLPFSNYRNTKHVFHTESCQVVEQWLTGSPEDWVDVLGIIGDRMGRYLYREQRRVIHMNDVHEFCELIAGHLYRDEVFKIVKLEDGEVPTRTNAHFFQSFKFRDLATLSRIVPTNV